MSRAVVNSRLASAVATNGTFAVSYPTGYTKGNFALGHRHRLVVLQTTYYAPKDFTISFSSTAATVTWLGTTTLPQGSEFYLGLDISGTDNVDTDQVYKKTRLTMHRPAALRLIDFGAPVADSVAALISAATSTELPTTSASTTYTFTRSGGSSPLDGSNSDGVIGYGGAPARNIKWSATHASSVPPFVLTVTSYDILGQQFAETLTNTTGTTTASGAGAKAHAKVISIKIADSGGTGLQNATLNVGFGSKLGFDAPMLASNQIVAEMHNNAIQGAYNDIVSIPWYITANEAGSGVVRRIPSPVTGSITDAGFAIETAANPSIGTISIGVAAATSTGVGTTVAGLDLSVATALTLGQIVTGTATEGDASQAVVAGQQICITPTATLTTGASFAGYVNIRPTGTLRGTFVAAAVGTTPSGTSGDVFGTYTPAVTLDGSTGISLLVALTDEGSASTPQYNP